MFNAHKSSYHHLKGFLGFVHKPSRSPRVASSHKGFIKNPNQHKTISNQHIIFNIPSRPLNHQWCGSKGFFIKPRASTTCQRPYKVIIIIQELHDPNKGCKVIKPSSVGPRTSSRLLQQARSFMHHLLGIHHHQ